jgi:hypothetical protein
MTPRRVNITFISRPRVKEHCVFGAKVSFARLLENFAGLTA